MNNQLKLNQIGTWGKGAGEGLNPRDMLCEFVDARFLSTEIRNAKFLIKPNARLLDDTIEQFFNIFRPGCIG